MGQQDDVLDELAERRAQAAQAIPLKRSPDPWKRPRPPDEGSNLGQIKMTDRGAGVFDTPEDTPHAIAVDVGPPEASPDWLEQWPDDPPTQAAPLVPGDQLAWWSRRPPPAIKGAER